MERFPDMTPSPWRRPIDRARDWARRALGEDGLRPIVAAAGALDAANRASARAGTAIASARGVIAEMFAGSAAIALIVSAWVSYGGVSLYEGSGPVSNFVTTAPGTAKPLQETPVAGMGWWPNNAIVGQPPRDGVMAVRSGDAAPLIVSRNFHDADATLHASSDLVRRLAADVVSAGPRALESPSLPLLRAILEAQIASARPDGGRYSVAIGPNLTISGPRPPAIAADGRIIIRGDSEVVAQFEQTQPSRLPPRRTIVAPAETDPAAILSFLPLQNALLVQPGAQGTGPDRGQSDPEPVVRRLEPSGDVITAFAPFAANSFVALGSTTGQLTISSLPSDEARERTTLLQGRAHPESPAAIVRIATRANVDDQALTPLAATLDAAGRVTLVWRGDSDRLVFVPLQVGEDARARPAIIDIRLAADGSTLAILTLEGRVFAAGGSADSAYALRRDVPRRNPFAPPTPDAAHFVLAPPSSFRRDFTGDAAWSALLRQAGRSLQLPANQPADGALKDLLADLEARAGDPANRNALISRQPLPVTFLSAFIYGDRADTPGTPPAPLSSRGDNVPFLSGSLSAIPSPTRLREIGFVDAGCRLTATSIALNEDGSTLLTGYASGHVSVTPLRTFDAPKHFLRGHGEAVLEVSAARGGGARVATRDAVSTIRLSDMDPAGILASWPPQTARCPTSIKPWIKRERIMVLIDTPPPPPPPANSIVVFPHVSRASPSSITLSALGLDRIALSVQQQANTQASGGEQPRFNFDIQALDRVPMPISANQIRFCNLSDRAAAEQLQNRLRAIDPANAFALIPINSLSDCQRTKSGTLEIWYGDATLPRGATAN